MESFIENTNRIANDAIRMSLFAKIKTGNILFDTIISTLLLTFMSYTVKVAYEQSFKYNFKINEIDIFEKLRYCFHKKYMITMTGKKCSSVNWNCYTVVSSIFGDSFSAVWGNIINNIEDNPTIYEMKDFLALTNKTTSINNNNNNNNGNNCCENDNNIFIVSQKRPFLFNKELQIFALVDIYSEESKNEKDKGTSKIENIEIVLYSYVTSLSQMKKYIDKITEKYLENIHESRYNKKFVYTLIKTKSDGEDCRFDCWKESQFDTTRSFDNMFFLQKSVVLEKIHFFLNNKEWYYKKGIPYTIGFGLHGPPGTGKTSFIKSLAKLTNRHIIVLSLKLIKTRRQLQEFFYEDRYNQNNKKASIGFDNKIIVIEDIDAQGDIVLDRSKKRSTINYGAITEKTSVGDVIKSIVESESTSVSSLAKSTEDEPITLDDILNLWDGIEETSGRIMVISSNHYNELDPALIRPGRIDVSIEMSNVCHNIIAEMYYHLYEKEINKEELDKVEPGLYSPAEIINLYLMNKDDETGFLNRLLMNKKLV